MVIPLIASLALCSLEPFPGPVQVSVVEINTVFSDGGKIFTQVLFWWDKRGGYLLDWKFLNDCHHMKLVSGSSLRPWKISWKDKNGKSYLIRASSVVFSATKNDPERENFLRQPYRPGIKPYQYEVVP